MIMGRVAPPKCLLNVATQIEKDQYTLIEQSVRLILLMAFTNAVQLYKKLISLAIAVHDMYIMQLRYIMCMMSPVSS